MKWLVSNVVIIFLFISGFDYADWEWWNEDEVVWKVRDRIELSFAAEQKFRNDMSDIYCYNFVPGFNYEFSNWLDLGMSYNYEREREYIGNDTWEKWLDEHRIQFDPALKWQWGEFKFSDRNRIEYRILEDRKDKWRYRNRVKIKRPLNFLDIEFTPYCSEEIFCDFYGKGLYKNRFNVGISKELTSMLELEIYYMLESHKEDSEWHHSTNVLGTIIVVNF